MAAASASTVIYFAQVDAFTSKPFCGNSAAVIILPEFKSAKWMQNVALEFNISETAFVVRKNLPGSEMPVMDSLASLAPGSGEKTIGDVKNLSNEFRLRWFTPAVEVRLCGHATLAAAHAIFSAGLVSGDIIKFHTLSGELAARRCVEDNIQKVELDFPLAMPVEVKKEDYKLLADALGVPEVVWAGSAAHMTMVELSSVDEVLGLKPDFVKVKKLPSEDIGVIVTATDTSGGETDFISRFFGPKAGIDEDPVTGSAHCLLTPYWALKLGKNTLKAHQASPRGGHLEVHVDHSSGRVFIKGQSVTVMTGALLGPTLEED